MGQTEMERDEGLGNGAHAFVGFEHDEKRCRNVHPTGCDDLRIPIAGGTEEKVDYWAMGLHECAYSCGLETCTESLCSESCDGMMEGDAARMQMIAASVESAEEGEKKKKSRRRSEKTEFPPPLTWMRGSDGRRSRFMKAERRDGRLILTDVRIERPVAFRARRESGRLRLHLIKSEVADDTEETSGEEFWRCHAASDTAIGAKEHLRWHSRFLITA